MPPVGAALHLIGSGAFWKKNGPKQSPPGFKSKFPHVAVAAPQLHAPHARVSLAPSNAVCFWEYAPAGHGMSPDCAMHIVAPNGAGGTGAHSLPDGQSRGLDGGVQPRAAVAHVSGGKVAAPPEGVHVPVASALVSVNATALAQPPLTVGPQPAAGIDRDPQDVWQLVSEKRCIVAGPWQVKPAAFPQAHAAHWAEGTAASPSCASTATGNPAGHAGAFAALPS